MSQGVTREAANRRGLSLRDLEDPFRQRRSEFGFIDCDVHLQEDVKQQSQVDNMVEYQDHRFRKHRVLEKHIAIAQKQLNHPAGRSQAGYERSTLWC